MRKKRIVFYARRSKFLMPLIVLCIFSMLLSGCGKGVQNTKKLDKQHAQASNSGKDEKMNQDEDMVSSQIDFEKLDMVSKMEENGITYYNVHTTKETPLPLNEWAKMDVLTEKGNIVPAYIRFTSLTRDVKKVEQHIERYIKADNVQSAFSSQPEIKGDEYVLLKYDILVGKDASLKKGDTILPCSVRFPLQLYSTMRSGNFGDTTVQERENLVRDVSIFDADMTFSAGTIIEKAVLCSVPKDYTAYGISVPYVNEGGTTQCVYFKLEYRE